MKIIEITQIHNGDFVPSCGKAWQWLIKCKDLCCPEELVVFCRKYLKDTDGEIIEVCYDEKVTSTKLKITVQGGYHELTEVEDDATEWIYTAVYSSTK